VAGEGTAREASERTNPEPVKVFLQISLIVLLSFLCGGFILEFLQMVQEHQQIVQSCNDNPGFSCDAVPQHLVGGFHVFSLVLLGWVIFTKHYRSAFFAAALYLVIHLFATYSRLSTGFFGGDMCPDGHPCILAIRRASTFDWFATALIAIALIFIGVLSMFRGNDRELN
jgi:hypothetical protein